MGFILKKESADLITKKYKNSYISNQLNLSGTFVSQVLHRKKAVAKHTAYAFTKLINSEAEVEDIFEQVR